MNNKIEIVPLNFNNLEAASILVDSCFQYEDLHPSYSFAASLNKDQMAEIRSEITDENNPVYGIREFEYFVATMGDDILGVTGIYTRESDYHDTAWLGWYCVAPNARGKKVGSMLLQYVIDAAKKLDKKYLALYTSTAENEKTAQKVYDKYEFKITSIDKHDNYDIIYRKKTL